MPRMIRDLEALTGRTFDVLVVGGGIYGLAIAYDAAQRGLGVALVERHDFGSGASASTWFARTAPCSAAASAKENVRRSGSVVT